MIQHLIDAYSERVHTMWALVAWQQRRHGASFNHIAQHLGIDPKKAKRMAERGQALYPDATDAELSTLVQKKLKKLGHSGSLLVQMVMRKPPGQVGGRN